VSVRDSEAGKVVASTESQEARPRITTGEGIRNHATDIVPDHAKVLQMQMSR
jgi:hypothetical protein